MDSLLRVLAGPWTLYILWTLRSNGPQRFAGLRRHITGISAKMLTERLRLLESEGLVCRRHEPTVPPQGTYALTVRAEALNSVLDQLNVLSTQWYTEDRPSIPSAKMECAVNGYS